MTIDLKLEVVVLPVADVERSKRFYGDLGWRLDADLDFGGGVRGIQYTPPGSPCSIHFGSGITSAVPGSVQNLYLVVSDVVAARAELAARGADISDVFHRDGKERLSGPHPERSSYASFATFKDPDGNSWLLQEVTTRFPDEWVPASPSSTRRMTSRPRFDVPLKPTVSTRSAPVSPTPTGRTGTRVTSSKNRTASHCRPRN